jgi:hypothetical protein
MDPVTLLKHAELEDGDQWMRLEKRNTLVSKTLLKIWHRHTKTDGIREVKRANKSICHTQ